jgi:hypothetical protein
VVLLNISIEASLSMQVANLKYPSATLCMFQSSSSDHDQ